jgi:hypothetical protein
MDGPFNSSSVQASLKKCLIYLADAKLSVQKINAYHFTLDKLSAIHADITRVGRDYILSVAEKNEEENERHWCTWTWMTYLKDQEKGVDPVEYMQSSSSYASLIYAVDDACHAKCFWPDGEEVFHVLYIKKSADKENLKLRWGNISPHSAPWNVPGIGKEIKNEGNVRDVIYREMKEYWSNNVDTCSCGPGRDFMILEM